MPPGCSLDELRKAYRSKVREWHPDQFGDAAQRDRAEEQMKLINEAFTTLKERAEAQAQQPSSPGPEASPYSSYSPSPPPRPAEAPAPTTPAAQPPASLDKGDLAVRWIAGAAAGALAAYAGIWFAAVGTAFCWILAITLWLRFDAVLYEGVPDVFLSLAAGALVSAGIAWGSVVAIAAGILLAIGIILKTVETNGLRGGVPIGIFKLTFATSWLLAPAMYLKR